MKKNVPGMENSMAALQNLKTELSHDPLIPFLGI